MAWPVAVAAALCGACGGQGQQPDASQPAATEAAQQTAPVTSLLESTAKVVPPPEPSVPQVLVAELDGTNVGFFAYGDGGDAATGVLAGVRIAVIEDPQAWWKALRDDTPDGMEALPPGYQVKAAAGRLQEAPARIVTTGADGTAVADRATDRSRYLYCALSPDVEDLIAGCSDPHQDAGYYSVYFSAGRAYFISLRGDRSDGSSHYGNFLLRRDWPTDPLTVTLVSVVALDFSDEQYPDGVYYRNGDTFAVVADADMGRWWSEISQGDSLALSLVFLEHFRVSVYAAAEWSGSHRSTDPELRWDEQVNLLRVPDDRLKSAPAQYLTTDADGTAQVSLTAGNYLICLVGQLDAAGNPRGARILDCIYEDITAADTVIEYIDGAEWFNFAERTKAEGIRVLEQAKQ